MNTDQEILDVVDENDRVIGHAKRGDIHRTGLRHRAVHIFLFNQQGELFVQQRGAGKDTYPLCYNSSASGHLDSGEDYDHGTAREVREELGITIPARLLKRSIRIAACADTGQEFVWLYRTQGDWHPVINRAELAAGKYRSRDEIQRLIATLPEQCAPCFIRAVREFSRSQLWPA
jgi:16S rRNA (adenine1518-N6/adenine1519-N6)-dimethyltransferase